MNSGPKVLLVGAGAVGQVYGRHLRLAGCDVAYLVKEKHVEETRGGFTLYPLGLLRRSYRSTTFNDFRVFASAEEATREPWDQIWLCVSSTALRSGDWVRELARLSPSATIVMLQPALDDQDWIRQRVDADRLVSGMIGIISFRAPLRPQDPVPSPGTAYILPPGSPSLFSGSPDRVRGVVEALSRGGCPAKRVADVGKAAAIPTAVLTAFVHELESQDWSFEKVTRNEPLARICSVGRELAMIAAQSRD